jgi:alpha-galactosidase
MQSMQLAQYLPLFSISCWETDIYEARSSGTMGMNCEFPYLDPAFSLARARAVIADVERTRGFWYGDFYPLTGTGIEPEQFVAYQLHRPDTGAGVVYGFRRRSCRTVGLIVGLNGLRTSATYRVEMFDAAGRLASTVEARGKELLAGLTLRVPQPGASVVVRYQPIR